MGGGRCWFLGRTGLPARRGLTIGEEGEGGDLGHLAARGVGPPAEVGAVLRVAWLARPAAGIAADNLTARQLLDPGPERVVRRHVGEGLLRRRDRAVPAGGHRRDLANLAS